MSFKHIRQNTTDWHSKPVQPFAHGRRAGLLAVCALISLALIGSSAQARLEAEPQVAATTVPPAAAAAVTTIVIVRHAERGVDDPADPALSPDGQSRADALVAALDGTEVGAIYSTQYKRTQQTAQPLGKRFKIDVTTLPVTASNSATYSEQLARNVLANNAGKTVVIVGHSNTVPELVKAFTGRTIASIAENEYDRFFLITCTTSTPGKGSLFQTRYGKPQPVATR